jgi:exoribonuclease R
MPFLKTKNYKDFKILKHLDMPESLLGIISGAKRVAPAMPGDEVDIIDERIVLKNRAKYPIIVGTIELTSKTLYGHTSRNIPIYLFQPMDASYPPMRVGCSFRDRSQNQLAIVNFSDWQASDTFPRGSLIRLLGPSGDPRAEYEALQWRYGSKLVVGDFAIENKSVAQRPLIQNGFTFNIDPLGCKDIDDIFTFEQISPYTWLVSITIADVSEYIVPGSQLDELAFLKGQTLYQDGKAIVPMLPPRISEEEATLCPGAERLGLSYIFIFDTRQNTMTQGHFEETRVINQKSFTYEEVNTCDPIFEILGSLASTLKGSLTEDPHEWVEEMMLLYNKEAAKILQKMGAGVLRAHAGADAEKLEKYIAIHEDLRFLAFESAKYCPVAAGKRHFMLGNVAYAHASSPLRRYADILNHRVIKAYLHKREIEPTREEICNKLNELQKNQKHHDRDYFFLQKMLESNVGEMDGTLLEQDGTKVKVFVPSWKRVIKVLTNEAVTSQTLRIAYYADIRKPHWDTKMVFKII